ncbi:phospholipid metabolism enzyme regulator [Purpureocillium lavendulum]|uniref:Phospholipid metabolism enzyme regulator n=1 Tax=Purpureocillium lavendulum TaxID=1247861 RepID=A0AB34FLI2_9HYPO|nr:phospholipid metabolism enzyme regulator [Purpureocillium lavendulum]
MKFTAAVVLAAAAGASAHYKGNATVVTEVVDVYTTYCPAPTEITHGTKTYTVTEPTTLTITDCPCTITKPVITTSSVACHTCGGYTNSTVPTGAPSTAVPPPVGTGSLTPTVPPTAVPTAGAGKAAALSGAGLAGIVGLAAFVL